MIKAGLVGGLGPESTIDYYQSIIKTYQETLNNPEILPEFIIHSINMYKVFAYIENEDLKGLGDYLVDAIHTLDKAGASFAIITANTPHIVFEEVASQVKIPVYSIVLETLKRVKAQHIHKIALLGTKFTMAADFFKSPFQAAGIEVIVPTEKEQKFLHGKIVKELEKGIVRDKTKANFLDIVNRLIQEEEVEGLILGCTELPMIFQEADTSIAQFNTTQIHVQKTVQEMLK